MRYLARSLGEKLKIPEIAGAVVHWPHYNVGRISLCLPSP